MRVVRNSRAFMLVVAAGLALAPLGSAQAESTFPGGPEKQSPEEMAREGLERMMRALRLLVESIPQYELPEVLENGDIIIRRVQPKEKPADPEFDETAT